LRQAAIELAIPLNVAAKARHHTRSNDLEDPPQRVTCMSRFSNRILHERFGHRIGACKVAGSGSRPNIGQIPFDLCLHGTDRDDMSKNVDSDGAQQLATYGADSGAGGRFAGACALEHIAKVVSVVLQATREIRVTGARSRQSFCRSG
jgi:hypothetical protein